MKEVRIILLKVRVTSLLPMCLSQNGECDCSTRLQDLVVLAFCIRRNELCSEECTDGDAEALLVWRL